MIQKLKTFFNTWIDTALIFIIETRFYNQYKKDRDFYNKVKQNRIK